MKWFRLISLCLVLGIMSTAALLLWTRIDLVFGFIFGRIARALLWATGWKKVDLCRFLFMAGLGIDAAVGFMWHGPLTALILAAANFWVYTIVNRYLILMEPITEDGVRSVNDGVVDLKVAMLMGTVICWRCFIVIYSILHTGRYWNLLFAVGLYALSGSYPGKTAKQQVKARLADRKKTAAYTMVYA